MFTIMFKIMHKKDAVHLIFSSFFTFSLLFKCRVRGLIKGIIPKLLFKCRVRSLIKGIIPKFCMLCFVLILSVPLLNLFMSLNACRIVLVGSLVCCFLF